MVSIFREHLCVSAGFVLNDTTKQTLHKMRKQNSYSGVFVSCFDNKSGTAFDYSHLERAGFFSDFCAGLPVFFEYSDNVGILPENPEKYSGVQVIMLSNVPIGHGISRDKIVDVRNSFKKMQIPVAIQETMF